MEFRLEPYHRDVPDDELIQDLSRVAAELGTRRVTMDQYNERGRFHATTLTRRFGSWFRALELAGLERTRNLDIPSEELFQNIADVWLKLGRQPRYDDIDGDKSLYSAGTYSNRFGTWRKALEAFASWANEGTTVAHTSAEEMKVTNRRTARKPNWRQRALVLMRDGATCRMCGRRPEDGVRLHVDHVKAWVNEGQTVMSNLQILCEQCNVGKSDLDPEAAG